MAIAEPFRHRGYRVIRHGDAVARGAADEQVVLAAIVSGSALIAVDLDMKRYARRFGAPNVSERYSGLHLIFLSYNEVLAAKRVEQAMSFIEHEWLVTCGKAARRLWVDIGAHRLTSYR